MRNPELPDPIDRDGVPLAGQAPTVAARRAVRELLDPGLLAMREEDRQREEPKLLRAFQRKVHQKKVIDPRSGQSTLVRLPPLKETGIYDEATIDRLIALNEYLIGERLGEIFPSDPQLPTTFRSIDESLEAQRTVRQEIDTAIAVLRKRLQRKQQ